MHRSAMTVERRNLSFVGRKRRRDFDRSLQRLRDLGMPEWAVECYRRAARVAGQLPHEVVCRVAVSAAAHLLERGPRREAARPFQVAGARTGPRRHGLP